METKRIHLDFHTSEYIKGIGDFFNRKLFQEALKSAGVDSITLFAKCHHGYCYYPTGVGKTHPYLKFDLLREQIDACREIGVKARIYITGSWSALDIENHPEWNVIDFYNKKPVYINGDLNSSHEDVKPHNSWKLLCLAGGYKNVILDTVREICGRYEKIDGLFFDIMLLDFPCVCEDCINGMNEMGLDHKCVNDVKKYMIQKKQELMTECYTILKSNNPKGTIFFNSGGAEINYPEYHQYSTYYELEDLPTSGGGYDRFPVRAKYFSKLNKFFVGMTGKFHTDWGEFGTYKSKDALKYECATMLMYGAGCSVGDQLHPNGAMDMQTYERIGAAFQYVKSIEEYCFHTRETTRLGMMLSKYMPTNEGISKILLENQLDFDVVFEDENIIEKYDLIILPDCVELTEKFAEKLNQYVKSGKALIVMGKSAVKNGKFQIDIGLQYLGKSIFDIDYLSCGNDLSNVSAMPILCYSSAHMVQANEGVVLANIKEPFFSRTYEKYCSHRNTPNHVENASYPAIIKNENVIYMAHEIGAMYFDHGCEPHRTLIIECIKKLYRPILKVSGLMSGGRVRLSDQTEEKRLVLHLTYAQPIKRGNVLMLEDMPEINGVRVEIDTNKNITNVTLQPENKKIQFEMKNNRVFFTVNNIRCHQIVLLEY